MHGREERREGVLLRTRCWKYEERLLDTFVACLGRMNGGERCGVGE